MGNRLLLADDSITIQKVVAIIFANEEFELTVVDNGTAALEKAREIAPDVMLVDALMPGKSGYEVCSEVRRDPALAQVPILLLIGAFEPHDEEKAKSCGADASISKPFESQQLIDKVKELLELGKSRTAAAPAAPAPAAKPEPAAKGAEDIWGDLSALDTMAPVQTAAPAYAAPKAPDVAAAIARPAQPAQPAAAAPAAPAKAAPAAVEEEIVEASFEDDLWGAFDIEEEPQAAAAPEEVFGVVEPEAEFEAEEFFTFDEDEEVVETGAALELVEEPAAQPEPEELFAFEEEAPLEEAPAHEPEPFQLPEYEPFALEEEQEPMAAAPSEPAPGVQPQAAPAVQAPAYEQAAAFETPAFHEAPPAQAPAAAAAPAGEGGGAVLSEQALREAISKVSRDVIERIVWEVVPDLAEVLIREEIRKLKAGTRG